MAILVSIGFVLIPTIFAARYSIALGLVIGIVSYALLVSLSHNYEPFGGKMREENDSFLFEACELGIMGFFRRFYRHLPANPRCRVCLVPFRGFGHLLRISPSRKNPNFCGSCIDTAPEGVHDMEVGVLFADIRGFTEWSSSHSATEAAERVSRFYDIAGRVLMQDDALIEYVGDQVMALYLPAFPSLRDRTADAMLAAAQRLVHEVQSQSETEPLRIGVGMNIGVASIGNIQKGGQKDFTAVGDVVNTASRLQAAAGPGEIVLADGVFEKLTARPEGAEHRLLDVKGKSEPVPVYILQPG
jgi:adenylate cyclase